MILFQQTYEDHRARWCHAREEFLYATINKALREQDTKIASSDCHLDFTQIMKTAVFVKFSEI